jgi:DNA-binding transcriptional LysR family regulator
VRRVVSTAKPFDPATSSRRFTIGAPDGVSAVLLPPLLANLQRAAPNIDISVRQLLPPRGGRSNERAWEPALAELETRAMDIAIVPLADIPARFVERTLYEETFVIASRAHHAYAKSPSLGMFCKSEHVLVSLTGDAHGFIDDLLAKRGLERRIALTVPNFMMALAIVAQTDFVTAVPKQFAAMHAARFGLTSTEAPVPLRRDRIRAVVSKAAMMDAGVAWLFGVLQEAQHAARPARRKRG